MEKNGRNLNSSDSENIDLNPGQQAAMDALLAFVHGPASVFILDGAAGTGKTTLVKSLCMALERQKISFKLTASTGRAAKVLGAKAGYKAITVHSLLYVFDEVSGNAKDGEDPWKSTSGQLFLQFDLRQPIASEKPGVIIVDEASMISQHTVQDGHTAKFGSGNLLADLRQFAGKSKLIFVGDACQLPPVAEEAFSAALSPDYWQQQGVSFGIHTLSQIVRQQRGNEILQVATKFRARVGKPPQPYLLNLPLPQQRNVFSTLGKDAFLDEYHSAVVQHGLNQSIAICHGNQQAHELNKLMRKKLGRSPKLQKDDLLMVVQNSKSADLVNGDQVVVKKVSQFAERAGFTFLKVEVESLFGGEAIETLLVADLLYNSQSSLSSDDVRRLLIDFDSRMEVANVLRNSDRYKRLLADDQYVNALRAKFGYAITVHKAQGGEWDAVFLYLNSSIHGMIYVPGTQGIKAPDGHEHYHRWFYTAITRAKEKLIVNDSPYVDYFARRHPAEDGEYWRRLRNANATKAARLKADYNTTYQGKVITILNQNERGVNGFMQADGGQLRAYFLMDARDPLCKKMAVGAHVSFALAPQKEDKGPRAIRIRLSDNPSAPPMPQVARVPNP